MRRLEPERLLSQPYGDRLPLLFAVETWHWWSRGMRAIGMGLLDHLALPAGDVVEVGCGSGLFLPGLRRRWPGRTVTGLDLRGDALARARQRNAGPLLQADLGNLPLADQSCALVVALDVFDQAGTDLEDSLSTCRSLLRPGGYLLLRVSSMPSLSSPHDAAFGTARRFRAPELQQALAAAGFSPVRLTHANTLLLPFAAINRFFQRCGLAGVEGAFGRPGFMNGLGFAVLSGEGAFLRWGDLPVGSSLFCLAVTTPPPSDEGKLTTSALAR